MDVGERRSLVQQQSIYISMLQQAIKRADTDWHHDRKVLYWMQRLSEHNKLLYGTTR